MNDHALKHGAAANLAKLPELCYSVDPADPREVVVIKAGVKGYYPAYRRDTPEAGQLLADQLNKQMNVTKAVEMAMISGSMFGWHVPGADPATWEEKLTRAGK
jgi:hypothetical protein